MQRLKYGTVEKIGGTSLWRVKTPFYWLLDYDDKDGWMVIADEGFVCNYGSIPRILRAIYDPTRYNTYVLHDSTYNKKVKFHLRNNEFGLITRKEADDILLEGIIYEGAGKIEAYSIYLGVRLFGWIAWYF